jgi:hypothetical protein
MPLTPFAGLRRRPGHQTWQAHLGATPQRGRQARRAVYLVRQRQRRGKCQHDQRLGVSARSVALLQQGLIRLTTRW